MAKTIPEEQRKKISESMKGRKLYEEVDEHGINTRDKKYLLAHLNKDKLSPSQAIHAKCYECMGYYIDGKQDCGIKDCPLYPFFRYNPHRIVRKKNLTDEQRREMGERLKKARKGA